MIDIVILDGYTTNPGDLDWGPIEALGNLTIYDRTAPEDLLQRAQHATIVLTNKTRIDARSLSLLPNLKMIAVMATGYDIIDLNAARKHNVQITNVRGYSSPSVVQHTFALILELLNRVTYYSERVRAGDWNRSEDFSFQHHSIHELKGMRLGILGYGTIGKAVADVGRAFGMNIITLDRHAEKLKGSATEFLGLEELLSHSDIVSLHCPLNEKNYHMIGMRELKLMQSNALLINTSRGGLVDIEALLSALNEGQIGGAGLDVLETEPPDKLISFPDPSNLIITPHQAWSSLESRRRLIEGLAVNIQSYLEGRPQNVVS